MKDPMRAVDRFCIKHPRFGIPGLMRYIAVGSGVAWILGLVAYAGVSVASYLAFDAAAILRGQVWRLVSFMFVPISGSWLGIISIFFYYWIGTTLEKVWGCAKFNLYVLVNMLVTIVCGFVSYAFGRSVALTASYIYLAMFFAFAVYFPDTQVLLMMIIPIKMKYLAYIDAAFFAYSIAAAALARDLGGVLTPIAAMLGFLLFCGAELLSRIPRRQRVEVVSFKKESARIRREQRDRLYVRKCSVCGKTEEEYPDMEFRFCSRCAGYHCFCEEHINDHVHFTE